ncbi:hypothetical protein EJJ20_25380 [Pseudomonas poae]|nr:hypothetical protein EJJ20_25380 [Pseudomonas poae]
MGVGLCGSWLACDSIESVYLKHRGDAIAGKPAPVCSPHGLTPGQPLVALPTAFSNRNKLLLYRS